MKKLVITTQLRENYGAHFGGAPNWKNKGGNTYVIYDESLMDDMSIGKIHNLIEFDDDYTSEETISTEFRHIDAEVYEDWETRCEISRHDDKWIVSRINENSGQYREEIKTISRTYEIYNGHQAANHTVEYELVNGRFAHSDNALNEELKSL